VATGIRWIPKALETSRCNVLVDRQTRYTYKLVVFWPPGGGLKEFHLDDGVAVDGEQNKLDFTSDYWTSPLQKSYERLIKRFRVITRGRFELSQHDAIVAHPPTVWLTHVPICCCNSLCPIYVSFTVGLSWRQTTFFFNYI
jgi:hypothetical protein